MRREFCDCPIEGRSIRDSAPTARSCELAPIPIAPCSTPAEPTSAPWFAEECLSSPIPISPSGSPTVASTSRGFGWTGGRSSWRGRSRDRARWRWSRDWSSCDVPAATPAHDASRMKLAILLHGGVDRSGETRVTPVFLWLLERLARRHDVHVFSFNQEPEPASWELVGARVRNIGPGKGWRRRLAAAFAAEHRASPFELV